MVFHRRHYDLVAGSDSSAPVTLRDEVDRLGRAPYEDNLCRVGGVQEPADRQPRTLVRIGCAFAEDVNTAVHVRVLAAVERGDPVDHRLRLLRRSSVVEVHERHVMYAFGKDRKIAANHPDIQRRTSHRELDRYAHDHAPGNCRTTSSSMRARSGSSGIWFTTSPANARIRRCRAWSSLKPRARR